MNTYMLNPKITGFLILFTLASCGTTTQFAATNAPPRPMQPRPEHTVKVYTAAKPERAFVEVGIIEAQQSSEFSVDDMTQVIASMRRKAARIGCDGLVVTGANDAVVGSTYDGDGYTSTLKGYRGVCIMFEQPTASHGDR